MTKVSRILIDPKRISFFINSLWNTLALIEDRKEAEAFFKDVFTRTEILMFAKRIQIAKMLLLGYDYQTISSFVRVGNTTISKVSDWLNQSKGAKEVILRVLEIEKRQKEKLEMSPPPRGITSLGPNLAKLGIEAAIKQISKRKKRKSVEKSLHSNTPV